MQNCKILHEQLDKSDQLQDYNAAGGFMPAKALMFYIHYVHVSLVFDIRQSACLYCLLFVPQCV